MSLLFLLGALVPTVNVIQAEVNTKWITQRRDIYLNSMKQNIT